MQSRRESRRNERRAAIVAVAAEWFLEHGYAGTAMSAIAAAIGGSKATLWSYFPSKEALFEAVIDHECEAYRARLSATLDADQPLDAALAQGCTQILQRLTSPRAVALHRLVLAEAGRLPEVGRIYHEHAPQPTWALIAGFLRGAMNRGQLRGTDPMAAARLLTTLCLMGGHYEMLVGLAETVPPDVVQADAGRAVDMFLRTYAIEGPVLQDVR